MENLINYIITKKSQIKNLGNNKIIIPKRVIFNNSVHNNRASVKFNGIRLEWISMFLSNEDYELLPTC
jgi:hypothetical protein